MEFEGEIVVDTISIERVNAQIQDDIAAALPVIIEGDPYTSRGIKIGEYPGISCGGTHVSNLSEFAFAIVQSVKHKKGRIRMSYEVGVA